VSKKQITESDLRELMHRLEDEITESWYGILYLPEGPFVDIVKSWLKSLGLPVSKDKP